MLGELLPFGNETDRRLWRSDGTPAGTWQVADLRRGADGAYPRNLTRVGDAVWFDADDGVAGRELWRTDGRGLTLVADLRPGPASGIPDNSGSSAQATFAHRGLLYFAATTTDGAGL